MVGKPPSFSEFFDVEKGLPVRLLRLKAPQVAGYIYFAASFLQVIEITWQLSYINALLVNLESQSKNLNLFIIATLRPIY